MKSDEPHAVRVLRRQAAAEVHGGVEHVDALGRGLRLVALRALERGDYSRFVMYCFGRRF